MAEHSLSQLESLYQTNKQPLILDVRPQHIFQQQQRLAAAVNIPLLSLIVRCYLLPDKAVAFAVVMPSPSHYTVTTDHSQHGSVLQDGSTAVWLKGATSLPDFLSSRGWTNVTSYLQDTPTMWAAAAQLSVLEQGAPADPQQLARRCLFAPSGLLAASIDQVETALLAQLHHRQHQQQQQNKQLPDGCQVMRAIDVGCGSGRDVAWLASRELAVAAVASQQPGSLLQPQEDQTAQAPEQQRQPQQQQQQQQQLSQLSRPVVHWHVIGVDEWLGALERAAELAEAMCLGPDRVCLTYAQICTGTGSIQQLELPSKSKLHTSPLASCTIHNPNSSVVDLGATDNKFDLVVCCRFLVRALLPELSNMLNAGGFVLYCTFLDLPGVRAFGRPSGPDHLLQPGELAADHFGPAHGYQVLQDSIVTTPDGREVCWFMARKMDTAL